MNSNLTKNLFTALFICITSIVTAQVGNHLTTTEEALELKSTDLKIVLTGIAEFDDKIKTGFEEHWTHMDYEFVKEFENDISNENLSFLIPINLTFDLINPPLRHANNDYTYPIYALIKGGKDSLTEYKQEDLIAYNLFSSKGNEKKIEDATYRASHMIRMLNDYLTFKFNDKLNVAGSRYRIKTCQLFSQDKKEILKYKLLIDKSIIEGYNTKYLDKKYPGDIVYATHEEFKEIVSEGKEGYCYFLPIQSTHSFFYIVHAETGKVLFATYGFRGFRKKEAKKLIDAVEQ